MGSTAPFPPPSPDRATPNPVAASKPSSNGTSGTPSASRGPRSPTPCTSGASSGRAPGRGGGRVGGCGPGSGMWPRGDRSQPLLQSDPILVAAPYITMNGPCPHAPPPPGRRTHTCDLQWGPIPWGNGQCAKGITQCFRFLSCPISVLHLGSNLIRINDTDRNIEWRRRRRQLVAEVVGAVICPRGLCPSATLGLGPPRAWRGGDPRTEGLPSEVLHTRCEFRRAARWTARVCAPIGRQQGVRGGRQRGVPASRPPSWHPSRPSHCLLEWRHGDCERYADE